jgi:hypothetical protein
MRDVELFVRYMAFQYSLSAYNGNLKAFLDAECNRLNNAWATEEADVRHRAEDMEASISAAYSIFLDDAFRKYDGQSYETRFNRAVFDIIVYYFADDRIRRAALSKKTKVKRAYEDLARNSAFVRSIESTTKSVSATRTRFRTWGQTLGTALSKRIVLPSIGQP